MDLRSLPEIWFWSRHSTGLIYFTQCKGLPETHSKQLIFEWGSLMGILIMHSYTISKFCSWDKPELCNPVGEGTTRRGTVTIVHFRKHPQVPHTAEQGAWDPLNTSTGKRSSLPQTRRFLTLLSQLCRDPAVGVRNGEEAWGSCLPWRWGPLPLRQTQRSPERPLQLHSIPHLSEAHWHFNVELQRIARRDQKAFLSNQCKEINENNRMRNTRDLLKKIKFY